MPCKQVLLICPSVHLSNRSSVHPSIRATVYPSILPPSVRLSVRPSLPPSLCLPVCAPVRPSFCQSARPSICSLIHLCAYLSCFVFVIPTYTSVDMHIGPCYTQTFLYTYIYMLCIYVYVRTYTDTANIQTWFIGFVTTRHPQFHD